MRTLALDQSSRVTGYAVFDGDKLDKYGHFTLTDSDVGKRLLKFKNKVISLIAEEHIEQIVFEDIQLQNNNVATHKILGEILGVLHLIAVEANIPYEIVPPVTWRSTCKIKGRTRPEQKKNAQLHVTEKYGFSATEDESDAICIGEHGTRKKDFNWS